MAISGRLCRSRILNAIVYPSLIPGPYPESLTRNKCHLMVAFYGVVDLGQGDPYPESLTRTQSPPCQGGPHVVVPRAQLHGARRKDAVKEGVKEKAR